MQEEPRSIQSTGLGLLAILIWSTSFAFARSVQEQLCPLAGAAGIYLLGGSLGLVHMLLVQRRGRALLRMPAAYLLVCGGLFVTYILAVQMGIGYARNRQQAIEVIVTNYLWPGLTMALSVPLLRQRARWFLAPGVLLGIAGVALAVFNGADFSVGVLRENLRLAPLPYVLGLIAAVSWALYSNLSRRLAGSGQASGVPVFLLLSGLAFGVMHLLSTEQPRWSGRTALELVYAGLFPGLLAYTFWEAGMRRGRIALIVAASYVTPLLSTIISCLYLGVPMGAGLWVACGLVVVGAVLSSLAIQPARPAARPANATAMPQSSDRSTSV